jgi:nicotinamide riboside transporter PnuC
LLAASFAIGGFLVSVISVHLVALLIAEGHPLAFAALVAGLVGIAQVPGTYSSRRADGGCPVADCLRPSLA